MSKPSSPTLQLPLPIATRQLYYQHQFAFVHLWIRIALATLLCVFVIRNPESPSASLITTCFVTLVILAFSSWYSSISFTSYRTIKEDKIKWTLQRHTFISLLFSLAWGLINTYLYQNNAMDLTIQIILLMIISTLIIKTRLSSPIEFYLHITALFVPLGTLLLLSEEPHKTLLAVTLLFAALTLAFIAHALAKVVDYLAEKNVSLQLQLHTDPVTKLINYQQFSQVIKAEWRRASRNKQQVSLQLIQLDDYSYIEENCSTDTLDQHLHLIADAMGRIARRGGDVLARYDTSTFIILFPDTGQKDSLAIAEKISKRIKNMQLIKAEGQQETLTASIGAATCSPLQNHANNDILQKSITISPAALISAAERALQKAQSKGDAEIEFQAL